MDNIFQLYICSTLVTCIFVSSTLVLRFFLRNKPSSQLYLIWIFVLIRLLFPFSLNLDTELCTYTAPQEITSFIPNNDTLASSKSSSNAIEDSNRNKKINKVNYYLIFKIIWYSGVICFVMYYLLKMFLLKKKTKSSFHLSEYNNVWMWNDYTSACVIGLLHPKIYIPLGCEGESLAFILRHEEEHIKHIDYLFVHLFYFALALNWYNPLAWFAYKTAIQDVEKACDERVLFNSTVKERQAYARVLVDFYKNVSSKYVIMGFGGSNIMKRIKNIGENKKNKKFFSVLILLICSTFLGICAIFHIKTDDQKIANVMGKEKIGVTVPSILYADDDKCIFYDYHGVFIYEFNENKLSDYVSFSEIGFSSNIQGDNATFAFSGNEGKTVYITNYTKLYIYDCNKKNGNLTEYSAINMPETSIDSLQVSEKSEDNTNNAVSQIYITKNSTKLYWTYEGDEGIFSELRLILDKNGHIKNHAIFK